MTFFILVISLPEDKIIPVRCKSNGKRNGFAENFLKIYEYLRLCLPWCRENDNTQKQDNTDGNDDILYMKIMETTFISDLLMCLYVLRFELWWPLRLPHKKRCSVGFCNQLFIGWLMSCLCLCILIGVHHMLCPMFCQLLWIVHF